MIQAKTGIEILAQMRCRAVNIGSEELVYGASFLTKAAREYSLPLISSNLRDSNGKTPAWLNRSLVIPVKDKKIAILGIINPSPDMPPAANLEGLTRQDPAQALQEVFSELKGEKIDFFILLSRLNTPQTLALVEQFPAIGVAIAKDDLGNNTLLTTDSGQKIMRGGRHCADFRSALIIPKKGGGYQVQPQVTKSLTDGSKHDKTIDSIIIKGMKKQKNQATKKVIADLKRDAEYRTIPDGVLQDPQALIAFLKKQRAQQAKSTAASSQTETTAKKHSDATDEPQGEIMKNVRLLNHGKEVKGATIRVIHNSKKQQKKETPDNKE